MGYDAEKDAALASPELGAAGQQQQLDWDRLRKLSLRPGGFREERVALWAQLLHADVPPEPTPIDEEKAPADKENDTLDLGQVVEPHPDERQVRLDTDRSFVLYPVDDMKERQRRQGELYDLIVKVFRKRRRLNYFQGYHDIVSVLYLTLPKELQLPAAEKLSLHRLRDSMGPSLEPVLGLLRVLKRILQDADPEYAATLESAAPLPYFALSNLLTLFSHDMPTLPLIQHVFDYLLCRAPIAIVYLAAAIILSRKAEVRRLEEEGEEGMIHSLLSSLPDLYDDDGEKEVPTPSVEVTDADTDDAHHDIKTEIVEKPLSDTGESSKTPLETGHENMETKEPAIDSSDLSNASHMDDHTLVNDSLHTNEGEIPQPSLEDEVTLVSDDTAPKPGHAPEPSSDTIGSFQTAPESADLSTPPDVDAADAAAPDTDSARRPRVHISTLLEQADFLFAKYPPLDPTVDLPSIMGPQSVMLTWSEQAAALPPDDAAELIVTTPHLVVLRPPEDDAGGKEADGEEDDRHAHRRRRRRLRKPRRLSALVERRPVLASAVLVLGVAMAVYGLQVATPERAHRSQELKRMVKYVGGLVFGMGGKLLDGLVGLGG